MEASVLAKIEMYIAASDDQASPNMHTKQKDKYADKCNKWLKTWGECPDFSVLLPVMRDK